MLARKTLAIGGLLASLAPPAAGQVAVEAERAAAEITEDALLADTRFLSHDLLAGRAPGSRGEAIAQAYIVARLAAQGLEPAGPDGDWLQPFDLVRVTSDLPDTLVVTGSGGRTLGLARGEEWVGQIGRQGSAVRLDSAEVVFVGYGIVAPEEEWDDYAGADVTGKVLLFLNNDPVGDRFGGDTRLYYGRWSYKYEIAAAKGAAAALVIHTTPSAGYPWQVVETGFGGADYELPAVPGEARLDVRGWVTEDAARRIVELAGHDLDALGAAAQGPEFAPVPLGVAIDLAGRSTTELTPTANVLARLPGADPGPAGEHLIYTAHYDHLGVRSPVDGDSIYNGARDNALGTAGLLAVARAFAALPTPPARSILFAAVGAEEQGLLGSSFFASQPTVPVCRLVANLNLDGGNIWGRTGDVRQIGRGKSDLDRVLDRRAAEQGRRVEPEAFPDRGFFYRSDQFSLAKVGVPALYLDEGVDFVGRPAGWGEAAIEEWTSHDYHQPSDEVTPAWDLSGMVDDTRLLFLVGLDVAESGTPLAWTPGDEFAEARAACAS